jgi:hypothetical protein
MNTAKIITDQELCEAFSNARPVGKKVFQATITPGAHPLHHWDELYFTATNKAEAVKIAREYAVRILGKKCRYVYLVR